MSVNVELFPAGSTASDPKTRITLAISDTKTELVISDEQSGQNFDARLRLSDPIQLDDRTKKLVLIEQGDAEGLAGAIRGMRDARENAERMGENARRALGDVYSREGACEQWRALLEGVAVERTPAAEASRAQ